MSHRLPDHAIGIEVREHNGAGLSPACGAAPLAILTLVTTVFAFVLTVEFRMPSGNRMNRRLK